MKPPWMKQCVNLTASVRRDVRPFLFLCSDAFPPKTNQYFINSDDSVAKTWCFAGKSLKMACSVECPSFYSNHGVEIIVEFKYFCGQVKILYLQNASILGYTKTDVFFTWWTCIFQFIQHVLLQFKLKHENHRTGVKWFSPNSNTLFC